MIKISPADAAFLTGVSQVAQRDWRRRGFIKSTGEGHSVFDAEALSELLLLAVFAKQGRVSDGAKVARRLAEPLARYVEATVSGRDVPAPRDVAMIWANDEVELYPAVDAALADGSLEREGGPTTLISLEALSTPWAIKVRDFVGGH